MIIFQDIRLCKKQHQIYIKAPVFLKPVIKSNFVQAKRSLSGNIIRACSHKKSIKNHSQHDNRKKN